MGTLGARWSIAVALLALFPGPAAAQRPFVERVDVARVLIDARVLDDKGQALTGLGPSDFAVSIDGDQVRVESVEWIEGTEAEVDARVTDGNDDVVSRQSEGRLIVVLVQKDLE